MVCFEATLSAPRMLFFYVATGPVYIAEARHSALSCRRQMASSRAVLLTPDDCDTTGFDEVVKFGSEFADPKEMKIAGIAAFSEAGAPRAIFMDSDTFVVSDVSELDELLDRYDLAAAHAPIRLQSNMRPEMGIFLTGAPQSYPEFNTGVIAIRRSLAVQEMLSAWLALYRVHATKAPPLRMRDQPSFREVTYKSSLRISTLPPEYNCVFRRPTGLCGPVKILHGRGNHEQLAKLLNRTVTFRAVSAERFLTSVVVVK